MVYALATLQRLFRERVAVAFAMLALALSFGVTGVFFGHVEHYSIMSLGCFAYLYYAVQYLHGERSIVAPALALALLLTTHLAALCLVPSLLLLPWLRGGAVGIGELARGAAVLAAPNAGVWLTVLFTYYGGSPSAVLTDFVSGGYTMEHWGIGNSLGGAGTSVFLPLAQIFSREHVRGIAALVLMYSPFLVAALATCLAHQPRRRIGWLHGERARLFTRADPTPPTGSSDS